MITIMVAEDFDIIREDLAESLQAQPDMQVTGTAKTGKEIVELVRENPPNIVLMDIEMETPTAGIHASDKISEISPTTKVIYLTAHDNREIVLTAMATTAVDYIVKSAQYDTLYEHIRAIYAGENIMEGPAQEILVQEFKRLRQSEKNLLFFIQNLSQLTNSERIIIHYLLEGYKLTQIARQRNVELVTIKTQISSILKKCGVKRSKEVVTLIRELNLEHLFDSE